MTNAQLLSQFGVEVKKNSSECVVVVVVEKSNGKI